MGGLSKPGEAAFFIGFVAFAVTGIPSTGLACPNTLQERTLERSCSLGGVERFFEKDRNLNGEVLF
jgi:hypothetical protein